MTYDRNLRNEGRKLKQKDVNTRNPHLMKLPFANLQNIKTHVK